MNIKNQIRTIKPNDPRFFINNGLTITPRAGIEISNSCPDRYKKVIIECLQNGWLHSVAHVTERELLLIGLNNDL